MYLVNQFNRVVEVTDEELIRKFLSHNRMREATPDEVEVFHQRNLERNQSTIAQAPDSSVYFATVSASPDGYGMSRNLIKREMMREGTLLTESYRGQKVGLLYAYPHGIVQMENDVRLIYTMFESDKIPDDWANYLNMADEVLVPSRFCRDTFSRAGVDATVVPLGYNDDVFKYVDRSIPVKYQQPFTFIHYNAFAVRKGFIEAYNAFTAEFSKNEPVKMIFKFSGAHPPLPIPHNQNPNIEVIAENMTEQDLAELLSRANCMVYPSRGEGFGITPLEAMATGLPAIIPNAHGISEYFNSEFMLEVKSEPSPAIINKFRKQDIGKMVTCDVDDLRKQMRFAYNNQVEMHRLGRKASEYVKAWTYKKTAKKLNTIIDRWQKQKVDKRPEVKTLFTEKL